MKGVTEMFEIKEVSNVEATARWGGIFASVAIGVGSNIALWGGLLPLALAC